MRYLTARRTNCEYFFTQFKILLTILIKQSEAEICLLRHDPRLKIDQQYVQLPIIQIEGDISTLQLSCWYCDLDFSTGWRDRRWQFIQVLTRVFETVVKRLERKQTSKDCRSPDPCHPQNKSW